MGNKSNFFTLVGKLQTTEDDIQANSNIVPFGKCKLKTRTEAYLPCIPALIKWQKTSPKLIAIGIVCFNTITAINVRYF